MKAVVITGAYGGMGYPTAKRLSENGFTVFALDRNVREEEPNLIPVETDVTDPESVLRAFERVKEQTDDLYAIVHFAGVYRLDSLVEMSEERFTGVFDVNLFGAYRINKAFLPLLKKGSRILLTSSELAPLPPLPFNGIYAITKTGVEAYAEALRMELQLLGIRVTVIRPGAVRTSLLSASTKELDAFCANTRLYATNADRFRIIVNGVEAKSVPAERVAGIAFRALRAQKPKRVYNLNRNPLLRIYGSLPAGWRSSAVRRILRK